MSMSVGGGATMVKYCEVVWFEVDIKRVMTTVDQHLTTQNDEKNALR